LVDPACRGQGIGLQLVKEALHILQDEQTIKLDATPAGRAVYLKLGFVDEYALSRMVRMGILKSLDKSNARPINKKDLAAVAEFDRTVFGADRQFLLKWMFQGAPRFAFVIEENDEVQGYCLGRQGYSFTHIGPVIAKDSNIAKKLVSAALTNCNGKPAILDVLSFDTEWKAWLTSIGFTEQRSLIRMYRGSNFFLGMPENQFAILGPEFG
jgi:ribosomal protein S18 acetylase RimI-like enzyme